ncbi:MAG: hypothetical protein ACYC63_03605 [Armatimonadota bacterium]
MRCIADREPIRGPAWTCRRLALLISCLLWLALGGCAPVAPAAAPELSAFLQQPSAFALPPRLSADRIIAEVVALHSKHGGATYNCYFGSLSGQKLYAVSLFPELGQKLTGTAASADTLRAFLAERQTLLTDPRCNVGTWYDDDSKCTYLDISATLPDKAQAVALGKKYNQISIFDLAAMTDIPTGGTGKSLPGWPPAGQRLPKLPQPAAAPSPGQPVPAY